MITRKELIKKYIEFFKTKNHKVTPNAPLIPQNDPTVLFTTAGMHPLVPYLLGQKHPLGKRLVNVQKCVRTTDIEEVGDNRHHTFIEMLGNWSLGDYWKKEAIEYSFEFLTKTIKIPKEKIIVTCFKGNRNSPKDIESEKVWKSLGIQKIRFLGKKDNWWGPAGITGPCGPDTEMFINNTEIWNDVFMEYNKKENGKYEKLKQKNVDTGMGLERTLAVLNGFDDNYMTEIWKPIIKKIEELSEKKYSKNKKTIKSMRIIADHIKAAIFILAEDVLPSNTEQGYVLRRLIRRAIRFSLTLGLKEFIKVIAEPVFEVYNDYKHLKEKKDFILKELTKEEEKFNKTLQKGLNKFKKIAKNKKTLSGKDSFLLYQSYGFPIEITKELAKENRLKVDEKGFFEELKKHQKLSKTSSAGKFKSGLADESVKTIKLHTATHLLNETLRKVLGPHVKQRGSNITPVRLRFDFNFDRKLTEKEKKDMESLVNKKINQGLKVAKEKMSLKDALKSGAQAEFGHIYPKEVFVYTILDQKDKKGWFSKEICTGPHVKNTKDIGKFKIIKEESSASGVRRIKAVLV